MLPTPPRHIAFIMDGNGRYAKKHSLPTIAGHTKGAEVMKDMVRACKMHAIPYVTFYAFSTENWKRPTFWVKQYFKLAEHYLSHQAQIFFDEKVRVKLIGNRNQLPENILTLLTQLEKDTAHFETMQVNLAMAYGGRDEIVRGVQKIAQHVKEGTFSPEDITEEIFEKYLDTWGIPDVDILIRTSGEQRLSNYLLYQLAYAELYFTPTLWPELTEQELHAMLNNFSERERRYGTYTDFVAE